MTSRTPAERRQRVMALPPVPDADQLLVNRFLEALWAENGLSRQTLDSYRRDLEGLARWREGRAGGLAGAGRAVLFDRSYMTQYSPVRDSGGKVIAVLFIGFDYTDAQNAQFENLKRCRIGQTNHRRAVVQTNNGVFGAGIEIYVTPDIVG